MYSLKPILATLQRQFKITEPLDTENLWEVIREAYYELCGEASWEALRDSVTYSYDADEGGMWLPADMIGIDCVTDGIYEWRKSSAAAASDQYSTEKKWYVTIAKTPLVSGTGMKIDDGDTTFSNASGITAAHIGEYVRIGGENAYYKIASATTLETAYRGPNQYNASYEVRPTGTKKIKLVKEDGDNDATEATIYFWRYPAQLYKESDYMLLPRADILELSVAEKLFNESNEIDQKNSVQKDLYGSKGRYEGKLDKAKAINPEFLPPIRPINNDGMSAGYGARRRYSV